MFKKPIKALFYVLVVALAVYVFLAHNLKTNAVFYAQHTPHRGGVEPVLMEVVSELRWIYTPDVEGIKYDTLGSGTIINSNYQPRKDGASSFSTASIACYHYSDGGVMEYDFDEKLNLVAATKGVSEKIDPQSINVDEIKAEIYHVVQPIIDAQYEPDINLQWLYDLVNHDRFN